MFRAYGLNASDNSSDWQLLGRAERGFALADLRRNIQPVRKLRKSQNIGYSPYGYPYRNLRRSKNELRLTGKRSTWKIVRFVWRGVEGNTGYGVRWRPTPSKRG